MCNRVFLSSSPPSSAVLFPFYSNKRPSKSFTLPLTPSLPSHHPPSHHLSETRHPSSPSKALTDGYNSQLTTCTIPAHYTSIIRHDYSVTRWVPSSNHRHWLQSSKFPPRCNLSVDFAHLSSSTTFCLITPGAFSYLLPFVLWFSCLSPLALLVQRRCCLVPSFSLHPIFRPPRRKLLVEGPSLPDSALFSRSSATITGHPRRPLSLAGPSLSYVSWNSYTEPGLRVSRKGGLQ